MIEVYALVVWYVTKEPREYGTLFRGGKGEVIEIFKEYGSCPGIGINGGVGMCTYAEGECEARKAEIVNEMTVGKSLIDKYAKRYWLVPDQPMSLDCVAVKIEE